MIVIQISSSLSPLECRLAVLKILDIFLQEAEQAKLKYEFLILQTQIGEFEGEKITTILANTKQNPLKNVDFLPKSLTISLEGEEKNLNKFLQNWQGTMQWICQSPFRPAHKRKNWFIGLKTLELPEKIVFSEKDLEIKTTHSSGAGGQHINKTNSAVRITHLPSGLSVRAETQRSQQQNKKLALLLLNAKLEQKNLSLNKEGDKKKHQQHKEVERGNAIRVFKGLNCIELKNSKD